MRRAIITIGLVILLAGGLAQAANITFTSDANIQAGDTWGNVYIHDTVPNHTTISMTGGSVTDVLNANDASTFNMSAGLVNVLNACDLSSVNISGGSLQEIQVFNSATVTFSQNATVYTVAAYSGIVNMNGGTISNFISVGGRGSGICNMNGGIVGGLSAKDASVINLRGGDITNYLSADSSSMIDVFGINLAKTNIGGKHNAGQITGCWQDGSLFSIDLGNSGTYSRVNLIPEPATLFLFGLGGLMLRKSGIRPTCIPVKTEWMYKPTITGS
jgi:PEP-CTERM motif